MKVPKKVKVGGHVFKIKLEKDRNTMGSCDTQKNIITLDASMPQDQIEATLIHEALHAMNTTLDGSSNMSHALLDSLAEQIYAFLSDNKLLK